MKVVLLSVNVSWTHSCLALYYLRNVISDLDYAAEIIEITLKQTQSEALEIICKAKPDVLCLSVYIWNIDYFTYLIPDLRKLLPEIVIVAGGPEVSHNQVSADKIKPDYLIRGYGEKSFRQLAEAGFTGPERVIKGIRTPLSELPFPYKETDKSLLKDKMLYYEASRGCAYNCIYCLSAMDEKMDWLPVERTCIEINMLLAFQPRVVKFVDRSFNQNKEWARAIWQYVIGLETSAPFHFEVYPDLLEETDIEILAKAPKGRIQLETGIQTVHPETLKTINRSSDWNKVKPVMSSLKSQTRVSNHADLIVGLPGEGKQHIIESVNAVLKTIPTELQLGFSENLGRHADGRTMLKLHAYLWSETAPYQVLQTPDLSFEDIIHVEKIAQIINQYWNKGDFTTVWEIVTVWRNPFDCLEELLQLSLAKDGQLHSIDRVKRFEVMAEWIEQSFPEDRKPYLLDAIRWDWCQKAGEVMVPVSP